MLKNKRVAALIGFLAITLAAANALSFINRTAELSYRDKVIKQYVKGSDGRDGRDGRVGKTVIQQIPADGTSSSVGPIRYIVVSEPTHSPTTTTTTQPQHLPQPPNGGGGGGPVTTPTTPTTVKPRSTVCKLTGVCL